MTINCVHCISDPPTRIPPPISFLHSVSSSSFFVPQSSRSSLHGGTFNRFSGVTQKKCEQRKSRGGIICGMLPVDPWSPTIDSQSIASQLFAFSLFPYLGFLYYIRRSKSAPKLTLFGFYFLLVFVGATIPAGIYAKVHYGTSLSNVDWLHGGAESLLTLSNLFVVLGLRKALQKSGN